MTSKALKSLANMLNFPIKRFFVMNFLFDFLAPIEIKSTFLANKIPKLHFWHHLLPGSHLGFL